MSVPWIPRQYQLEALEFVMARHSAGLLLDPGLGKTSTYLAYICVLKEQKRIRRTLVVAPMRVAKTVWPFEAQKWDDFKHLKVCDLTQLDDDKREELLRMNFDIYVINPESLHKVLNPKQLKGLKGQVVENKWNIDLLIIDESTRFADPQTMRFKALKPTLVNFEYRNIATGTPTPNGLHQLFGQCYILDFGHALGGYITHFRQRYMCAVPNVPYTYQMVPGAAEQIYAKVSHMLLRMRAIDKLEMPELIHNRITVQLPAAVRKQYDEFERKFLITVLDETIPAFNRASLGIKCRQISNGFIYSQEVKGLALPLHEAKIDALEELLVEMQGRPLLLMYEFIEDCAAIQRRFPYAVNITSAKNVDQVVRDFNAGKIPLLMGHPRSAGHGLNLQDLCADICWFGVTWDLELWLQAIARVWRQGQPSATVRNHVIMCEGTTDEGVLAGLGRKGATQDKVDQALIDYAHSKLG